MATVASLTKQLAAAQAAIEKLTALTEQLTAPKAETIVGETSRSKDGRDFPCTAAKPCSRKLRSTKRAAIHGVDAGGHEPR